MTVKLGLLALLEAKPGKGNDLSAFLEAGRALAVAEEGTVTWYTFKIGETSYGIFDTFETDDDRQAHLNGEIPVALGRVRGRLACQGPRYPSCRHCRREIAASQPGRVKPDRAASTTTASRRPPPLWKRLEMLASWSSLLINGAKGQAVNHAVVLIDCL